MTINLDRNFSPSPIPRDEQIQKLKKEIQTLDKKIAEYRTKQTAIRHERKASSTSSQVASLNAILDEERQKEIPAVNLRFLKEKKLFELEHANSEGSGKHVNVTNAEDQRIAGRKFIKAEIAQYEQYMPRLSYDKIKRKVTTDINAIFKESKDLDKYSVQMLKHELDVQIKAKKLTT